MARGRMLLNTLGSSRCFAALGERAGKLAEFAQALYPLIVALTKMLLAVGIPLAVAWLFFETWDTWGDTGLAEVYLLAAEPDNPEMGTMATEKGFLQISLFYPLDTGPAAAMARAELIRATFIRGASFAASGVTTTVERTPEIAPAMIEEDRYHLPVRVRFYAHHAT